MYKKLFVLGVLLLLLYCFVYNVYADEFADILQDLAIQTACLGMYSSTQAGAVDTFTNRFIDPPDWYTPPMMASRFADMSGNMTHTITFYGICFDYALFAWYDIQEYKEMYNNAGMKKNEWYIAITLPNDPNTIILYVPAAPDSATRTWNGFPVREVGKHRVRAHDDAKGHAWLWVQHNNGTWYWIDPTWTDNTGYPWWGIVRENKEVQYYPDPYYAVAANYPRQSQSRPNETNNNANNNSFTIWEIGYNYEYNMPLGFFIGLMGLYTTWNFSIPDLSSYEMSYSSYDGDGKISWSDYRDRGLRTYDGFEWILGYKFNIIPDFLKLPVGGGAIHSKELRLYDTLYSSGGIMYTEWYEPPDYDVKFVFEIGLQILFNFFTFGSTYRLKGFKESSFTFNIGLLF